MASATHFGDANSGFQAGTINGPVNTEFHTHLPPGKLQQGSKASPTANDSPPAERLETPPNPSAVIPFSRDTDFVDRGAILDQIHHACTAPGSRTALVGLGGVGQVHMRLRMRMANHQQASRNSPSNMRTEAEGDRQTGGCSGYTRATRPALSRAFETLRTASRSLGGRMQGPIYFSLCTTGWSTTGMESGPSYLTMWTMPVFSSRPPEPVRWTEETA